MFLSNDLSPKYLWLIEMVVQLCSIIACFVLLLVFFPSYPEHDHPPEEDYINRFILSDLSVVENAKNCSSVQSTKVINKLNLYDNGCDCRNVDTNDTCSESICRFSCINHDSDCKEIKAKIFSKNFQNFLTKGISKQSITDDNILSLQAGRLQTMLSAKELYKTFYPSLLFIKHDECPYQFREIFPKFDEATNDLYIGVCCTVFRKIIFMDRPGRLTGVLAQYENNKRLYINTDLKEILNLKQNDLLHGCFYWLDELLVKRPPSELVKLTNKCPVNDKEYTIYCKTCKKTVCDTCSDAEHKEHETFCVEERNDAVAEILNVQAIVKDYLLSLYNVESFANHVNKVLNDIYDNIDEEPICTKEEIENLINKHKDEYISYAIDNRSLAFIWKYVAVLYNQCKNTEVHGFVFDLLYTFQNYNFPDIDDRFLLKQPTNIND